jgi:hypothetical protein
MSRKFCNEGKGSNCTKTEMRRAGHMFCICNEEKKDMSKEDK